MYKCQISDQLVTEDGEQVCKTSKWISSDVISARAVFTQIIVRVRLSQLIDGVLLKLKCDFKEVAIDLDDAATIDSLIIRGC